MCFSFFRQHKKELIVFAVGVLLAILTLYIPAFRHVLRDVDSLGYPGMFIAGIMYGSGLTASIATIIFLHTPPGLHLVLVAVLGGLGSALYDVTVFLITRRETEHGWLAAAILRLRQRHQLPNWITIVIGSLILVSPLPDELAAGMFGLGQGKARTFFAYSFVSNTVGVALLSSLQ